MKNFIEEGKTIDYPVIGAPVASGEAVAIGDIAGVAIAGGPVGETIAVAMTGVYRLPKATGALPQGKKVYLNIAEDGTKTMTTTVGSNAFVGNVWVAAVSADTTVDVKLQG